MRTHTCVHYWGDLQKHQQAQTHLPEAEYRAWGKKAQGPNGRIGHARTHAEHCEQLEYTCRRVKNISNAELTC